ncbi:MAG: tRNA uracil 4-sulfurtransferase ThiI [Planctomycetota bacterium]
MIEPDVLVIRYGELALKGGNRARYEQALARNIRAALRPLGEVKVRVAQARILAYPTRRARAMARRAAEVFGVKSVSPAYSVGADLDAIVERSREVLMDALERDPRPRPIRFAVRAKRADKTFPLASHLLAREVAGRILPGPEFLKVDLTDPEMVLGIEVRGNENYVFVERIPGPGGLPVGTSGKGLCLLSGGIDSPVAAWLSMKRGLTVDFVSFHSFPYLGDSSKAKIRELARAVSHYQGPARLFVVPFTAVQEGIRDAAPERYRTVLYRRMMTRIACAIAEREGHGALITGESLGQVASQTLENMGLIDAPADRLILRPLVTADKEQAIDLARSIGTLEISNRPEPDCCTVFQPRAPVIYGKQKHCVQAETRLPMETWIEDAVRDMEVFAIDSGESPA